MKLEVKWKDGTTTCRPIPTDVPSLHEGLARALGIPEPMRVHPEHTVAACSCGRILRRPARRPDNPAWAEINLSGQNCPECDRQIEWLWEPLKTAG